MSMVAKIAKGVVWTVLAVYAGLRAVADIMGIAELFESPEKPLGLGERFLNWLFATPWWVPSGIIVAWAILTLLIFRESPRPKPPETNRTGDGDGGSAALPLPRDRPRGLTPLPEAARRAYEEMRESGGQLLDSIESRARQEGRSITSMSADYLVLRRGLAIHGNRPPSTRQEAVPPEAHFDAEFSEDSNQLVGSDGKATWTNLVVREGELLSLLAAIGPKTPAAPPTVNPSLYPDLPLAVFVRERDASDVDGHLEFVGALFARLEQRAVLGGISVWGRKDCPRGQKLASITLIPASHWESAHLDIVEYLEDPEKGGRTRPTDAGGTYYSDLYLNRVQANGIFPPSAFMTKWINMRDAFVQICNLTGLNDATDPTADRRVSLWPVIRQKARDGEIVIRGRPTAAGGFKDDAPLEDIPKEHWRDFDFEETRYTPDVDDNDVRFGQTIRQNTDRNYMNFDRYCDLHADAAAIARLEWKP